MTFNSVTITAPGDSPNTDGIRIGISSSISITHSTIGTCDDCISLSPGSEDIYITNLTCGPGHGIGVGSLGGLLNEQNVKGSSGNISGQGSRKMLSSLILHHRVLLVFFFALAANANIEVFDVRKFGAVGDGKTDCSKAFLQAFEMACAWEGDAVVYIPVGTYYAGLTIFNAQKDRCKFHTVRFQVEGLVKAPTDLSGDSWIKFRYIKQMTLDGGGIFDGQGASAWPNKLQSASLRFDSVTDSTVNGIQSVNSKGVHINLSQCKNMTFDSVTITAPGDSPNTDGIHIGISSSINIMHSTIGTGDDCISLSSGSKDIYIANLTCGPGHGIGVGSLGGLLNEQNYSSNVQINDVHYRNIWGTSTTKLAVNFVCSQTVPCQELELKEINLKYNGKDGPVAASCSNARGVTVGQVNPQSCLQ
ncbi:hypothetical protein IFM89_017905 [Coptis chinensis]|uniref:Polygalacturonase n=1 Tax=Coptis chinensis TaxID=261450 RepID=A0A835I1S4_9MAGN|nr:hypothetical protein IFM89_017905 [Coptis chinensis]